MSSSVPKSKRRTTKFDVVDNADEIYNKILNICLRMPKRYTYLILQDILHLSGEVADYTSKGDSVLLSTSNPYSIANEHRASYFIQARASLKALIKRMNFFLLNPNALRQNINGREIGVTIAELDDLSDLMRKEHNLINGVLDSDRERLRESEKKIKEKYKTRGVRY